MYASQLHFDRASARASSELRGMHTIIVISFQVPDHGPVSHIPPFIVSALMCDFD